MADQVTDQPTTEPTADQTLYDLTFADSRAERDRRAWPRT